MTNPTTIPYDDLLSLVKQEIEQDIRHTYYDKIAITANNLISMRYMLMKGIMDVNQIDNEVSINSDKASYSNSFALENLCLGGTTSTRIYDVKANPVLATNVERDVLMEFLFKSHSCALTDKCFIKIGSASSLPDGEHYGPATVLTDDGCYRSEFSSELAFYEKFPALNSLNYLKISDENRAELIPAHEIINDMLFNTNPMSDEAMCEDYEMEDHLIHAIDTAILALRNQLAVIHTKVLKGDTDGLPLDAVYFSGDYVKMFGENIYKPYLKEKNNMVSKLSRPHENVEEKSPYQDINIDMTFEAGQESMWEWLHEFNGESGPNSNTADLDKLFLGAMNTTFQELGLTEDPDEEDLEVAKNKMPPTFF